MNTKIIARVNGVDILSTSDEQFVAIRPICEALGVDPEGQRQRIERDEILGPVACLIKSVAADGKCREMYAIPYCYVFGWLFSIDISRINENVKASVLEYKLACYKALFTHFTERQTFLEQKQTVIEQKVTEYQECQRLFKDAQQLMNEAKTELNQVMKITIDDWRANNCQLDLPFISGETDD